MWRWMERIQRIDALQVDDPNAIRLAVNEVGIQPGSVLYYWGRWDEIHEYKRDDLLAFASLIWKAAPPDDVDIFDDSLDWLLTIEHTGEVGWIDFRPFTGEKAD